MTGLWPALESMAVPSAVDAEWRALLGGDYPLARPFLKAARRRAESHPHPRGGGPLDVVVHAPGDVVGVDPDTGRSYPLGAGQIELWDFDRPRLLRALALSLGVVPDPQREPAWSRRASVGSARSAAGLAYPCVYVEARRSDEWAVTAGQLLHDLHGPFVLLTPTRRWVPRPLESQLRLKRSALVPLDETLAWDGPGRFRAALPLAATLAGLESLGPAEYATSPAVLPTHLFRRGKGGAWAVRFEGKPAEVAHVVGMAYLARLLAAPGRGVAALDLQGAAPGGGRGDEQLDREGRAGYLARLRALDAELGDAKETGDVGRQERVLAEVTAVEARRVAARSPAGPRRLPTPESKARTAVSNAIRRAIDGMIAPAHPELGRHLDLFVSTGESACYHPGVAISWEL